MQVYAKGATARLKEDRSPVTEADEIAEAIILERLARLLPEIPVIAEECCAKGIVPTIGTRFVLVDPLDGTKEFLNRNGEFTVNIALIEHGVPVAGCVFAPAVDRLYAGGGTAWRIEGGIENVETPAELAVQRQRLLCRRHAAARPDEQRIAQQVAQAAEQIARGRLRDTELVGRARNAARLDDGTEHAQQAVVDRCSHPFGTASIIGQFDNRYT